MIWSFCAGAFIAFVITMQLNTDTLNMGWDAQKLISQCESELPRNKHCVIKAEEEADE